MIKIFYIIVLFSLFSCNENPVQTPDNLLEKEVMVNILYDIAVLQAANGHAHEKLVLNNIQTKDFIYIKYKIDSTTFFQNHKYYAGDVEEYKKMYTKVINKIELETLKLKDTVLMKELENKSKLKEVLPQ